MLEQDNIKTIGITSIDNEKVEIKIPLKNGSIWEKEYNKSDLIQQLMSDFKEENKEEIPEEYINAWKEKNDSFKETDEIRTLLPNEVNPSLILSQREHNIVIGEEKIPDFIGKPFSDPFEVFVFNKRDKSLKIQKYDQKIIGKEGLANYGSSSAYCNGDNNLFISGGEKRDGNIIGKFWKIKLDSQTIETFHMPPKKNHSMIYIPGGYTFIVGGNDKKTYFFDDQNNQICLSSDLNNNRTEPALILVSDNLYCFDNINSKNSDEAFTCEKMDLREDSPKWVLITPIIDFSITNQKMNQKFFGVVKTNDDNVLFLGGNMDKNQDEECFNYKYVIEENTIQPSNVPFQEYNLKEKTFLTYKKDIEYILPDFNRYHPEVLFFQRNKDKLSLLIYEPKTSKSKTNDWPIIEHKFNFNMPNISKAEKADINIDGNINKNEGYILGINIGKNEEINVDIEKPTINIQNPSYNIHNKSENHSHKDSDDNQDNKKLFINVNGSGDINTPNVKNESIKDINNIKPNLDVNIEGPKITTNIDLPITDNKPPITENLNLEVPEIRIGEDIKGQIELNDNSPKILLNDIITSKEDGKKDDLKLKLNTPQVSIAGQKIEAKVDYPKFDIGNINPDIKKGDQIIDASIKPSDIDIGGNNLNVDLGGLKIDENIKSPDIDIKGSIPQVDFEGPKIDTNIKSQNIDIKGSIPKIDIQGPKIETNLKGPNLDINEQNLNIIEPNINMPSGNIEIKSPEIKKELNGNLNANLNMPKLGYDFNKDFFLQGTIKGTKDNTHLKEDFNLVGVIDGKNGNFDLDLKKSKKGKDKDIYLCGIIDPSLKVKANAPGIEVNGPNINSPSAGINANKNINITGNIPKIEGQINNNNLELNYKKPNFELPSGNINIKGPQLNTNNELEGTIPGIKVNGPKINGPKFDIKSPEMNVNINSPNLDIKNELEGIIPGTKSGKVDIKGPNIDIKGKNEFEGIIPGIKGGKVDIKGPNLDIKNPEMNANIKGPNLDIKGKNELEGIIPGTKSGKLDIKGPNLDIKNPGMNVNIKGPNLDIKGKNELEGIIPGTKSGKVDIKGPKINVNAPNAKVNIKEPNINLKGPHYKAYINERESYISGILPGMNDIKTSNIILPSGKIDLEGPKIDANINGNVQNFNMGKLEGPKVDLNIKGDKIDIPDINIKNSDLNGNINLKAQNPSLNGKTDLNLNVPKISINGPSINNMNDFVLSGVIPSKNDKNREIIIDSNINANGDINTKLNAKNKLNFHGNLNDMGEIKGPRKFKGSIMNNENDYNLKVSQNKMKISGNNFQAEPLNINRNIPNDLNLEVKNPIVKLQYPNLEFNTDNKMDIKGSNNLQIGGGEIGGGINLSKNNDENKFGVNINLDTNFNELKNSLQEDKNKENKNSLNNGVSIRKNFNAKLPMVGPKDNNFVSSKIAEVGKFDGGNINIDIKKTANVGINGQKVGDRIEY